MARSICLACISALFLHLVTTGAVASTPTVSRTGGHDKNAAVKTNLVRDEKVPPGGFGSLVLAVEAAANRYNPDSIASDREHVGAILQRNADQYFYTHGVGREGQDTVSFAIAVPRNFNLVALWHTHGKSGLDRRFFSALDTGLANEIDKPFYLADYTGVLKVFNPGDRVINSFRRKRSVLTRVRGSAVGTFLKDASGRVIRIRTR